MGHTTVSLSGTTPQTLDFRNGATVVHLAQVAGANTGTVTVEVRLPGQSAYQALDGAANSMDLSNAGQAHTLNDCWLAGIRLTGASLSGSVDIGVAWK